MKEDEELYLDKPMYNDQIFSLGIIIQFYEFVLETNEGLQEYIYDYLQDGEFCGGVCVCEDVGNCFMRNYVGDVIKRIEDKKG